MSIDDTVRKRIHKFFPQYELPVISGLRRRECTTQVEQPRWLLDGRLLSKAEVIAHYEPYIHAFVRAHGIDAARVYKECDAACLVGTWAKARKSTFDALQTYRVERWPYVCLAIGVFYSGPHTGVGVMAHETVLDRLWGMVTDGTPEEVEQRIREAYESRKEHASERQQCEKHHCTGGCNDNNNNVQSTK